MNAIAHARHGQLAFPARLNDARNGTFTVTFRHLPEIVTQGEGRDGALAAAVDALSTALWFRLRDGQSAPRPGRPRKAEVLVDPEPAIVMKMALTRAAGGRRGAAAKIARGLGIDHKEARRLLDPTEVNRADRLARALELFGHRVTTRVEKRAAA